jgi:hypothetical protein
MYERYALSGGDNPEHWGCTMGKIHVGVVSAAEFDRAGDYISELANYCDYEDWLDSRYGRFMGLSTAGAETSLNTVALDDFLDWCGGQRLLPSEAALDVYVSDSDSHRGRETRSAAG